VPSGVWNTIYQVNEEGLAVISVIFGKKGSGKTKKIIELANQSASNRNGDIVYIDDDNRYMYDLHREIRFINAGEFQIGDPRVFFGFISGIVAGNYDIDLLFIDGFLKIVRTELDKLNEFFDKLKELANQHNIRIVISISGDPENIPDFLNEYLMN